MNCNHSNYLQYTFFRTQVVKDKKKKKYILAAPWVHFPDGLLLLLPDLVSAFIPQPQSLLQRLRRSERARAALAASLALCACYPSPELASVRLAHVFWLLSGLINFEQQICLEM